LLWEYNILVKTIRPHLESVVFIIIKIAHLKSLVIYINWCGQFYHDVTMLIKCSLYYERARFTSVVNITCSKAIK